MNTSVSIDVDMLDAVPAKTFLRVIEAAQTAERHSKAMMATVRSLAPMFRELEHMDIEPRFDLVLGSIDLAFTGDGDRLGKVWAILRRHGYSTHSRPKKGDMTFSAFWDCEGQSKIWMSFSSSICKRVQVGTEMKEVPIYETRCDELDFTALEGPTLSIVPSAPEIPF